MSVSIEEVKYIAKLAKLEFNEKELEQMSLELSKILDYMAKLNELDTSNIEPLAYPHEINNVFREDKLKSSISNKEALKNAPDKTESFFKVPKVIKSNK